MSPEEVVDNFGIQLMIDVIGITRKYEDISRLSRMLSSLDDVHREKVARAESAIASIEPEIQELLIESVAVCTVQRMLLFIAAWSDCDNWEEPDSHLREWRADISLISPEGKTLSLFEVFDPVSEIAADDGWFGTYRKLDPVGEGAPWRKTR